MTLHELLLKKYPPAEYALMKEVSDAAGFSRSRSADYIAVNLWPSRGLAINGIEVKSYRSDWLNELKNPAKAENILQYCDYWWLVTDKEGIAKLEEIPVTWGWMEVVGNKIKIRKEAPKLSPVPISRHFMASMLKRACSKDGYVLRDSIKEEIDKSVEAEKKRYEYRKDQALNNYEDLRKCVDEFEANSGIRLKDRWRFDAKKTGEAVKFIADGGLPMLLNSLKNIQNPILSAKETVDNMIDTCECLLKDELITKNDTL